MIPEAWGGGAIRLVGPFSSASSRSSESKTCSSKELLLRMLVAWLARSSTSSSTSSVSCGAGPLALICTVPSTSAVPAGATALAVPAGLAATVPAGELCAAMGSG